MAPILMLNRLARLPLVALLATLAACATTSVEITGTPSREALCQSPRPTEKTLVVWSTRWRADQKDKEQREAAAEQGLQAYVAQSTCFLGAGLRKANVAPPVPAHELAKLMLSANGAERVVIVVVRELGPVVKLLSSSALVEGGTEVVLDIMTYNTSTAARPTEFSVHWKNGGSGVVKGVSTLPHDMREALTAAFEPHERKK